jgi:hypothetical protein
VKTARQLIYGRCSLQAIVKKISNPEPITRGESVNGPRAFNVSFLRKCVTYPNCVTVATVMAVKCRRPLQQPTAFGMFIPSVPFEEIASVTKAALLFKRNNGSVCVSALAFNDSSRLTTPFFERSANNLLRMMVKTSCPFKQTRCKEEQSSIAASA